MSRTIPPPNSVAYCADPHCNYAPTEPTLFGRALSDAEWHCVATGHDVYVIDETDDQSPWWLTDDGWTQ